jgi:mono/diheme cytochrome c family protein
MIASFLHRSSVETQPNAVASQRSLRQTRAFGIIGCLLLTAAAALFISERSIRAQAPAPAPKPAFAPAGNAKNGKQIFEAQGCLKCHGSEGQGRSQTAKESAVPQIAPTRLALPAFLRFVRSPAGQMPPYSSQQVSDSELADLYAFLQSLAPSKVEFPSTTNAQNGQRLYFSYGCYECHGGEAQGSVQTGGSRLGPVQIPFSAFASYVRQPAGQMPPYARKAVSDAELADIYAFLKSRPEATPSKGIALLNQ